MTLASNFNSLSSILSENSGNFSKKRSNNAHLTQSVVLLDSVKRSEKWTLAQYYHILTKLYPQLLRQLLIQLKACILAITLAYNMQYLPV